MTSLSASLELSFTSLELSFFSKLLQEIPEHLKGVSTVVTGLRACQKLEKGPIYSGPTLDEAGAGRSIRRGYAR